MITAILLLCLPITLSAVPVSPNVLPSQLSHRGVTQPQRVQTEAVSLTPDNQTPAPLAPIQDQPQLSVPQQPDPQSVPQLNPFMQQYTWSPQGGSPLVIPLQPSIFGRQPTNQLMLQQQPLIFPPFGYFPVFSTPYNNPQAPPYGYPMTRDSPAAAASPHQLTNTPVSPAENVAAAPAGGATLPVQQQQQQEQQQLQQQQQQQPQNPQRVVYMLQQQMTSPLGSLSSEELQVAAKLSRLGVYMPTLMSNQPAGVGPPEVRQAAGLTNPEQRGVAPTMGTSGAAAAPQPQGLACSGSQVEAGGGPAGLENRAQEAATVQTPVGVEVRPTPGNPV